MVAAFRCLLTFNATSLIIVVFLIKRGKSIADVLRFVSGGDWPLLSLVPVHISYVLYFVIPIVTTWVSIYVSRFLESDEIRRNSSGNGQICEIEMANNTFLPSYLGYFFVALSIGDVSTLVYMYGILFVFTFLSQSLYFNPLFLIFGYHFYYVKTNTNMRLFVIAKSQFKAPQNIEFTNLKRINNYTFIDGGNDE